MPEVEMTFPAELERLLKEATDGKWQLHVGEDATGYPVYYVHGFSGDEKRNKEAHSNNVELIALLRNHADAILGLVRAAEDALLALNMGLGQTDAGYEDAIKQAIKARDALTQELAKLNGEGK